MRHSLSLLALATALACGSVAVSAAPVTYNMDPHHTDVVVTWSHFGFSQPSAMFNNITGTITYDPDNVAGSSASITIPIADIHTSAADLDEHLQHDDFFDAAKWPNITFQSTKVVAGDAPDMLEVTGELSFHGVTQTVTIPVKVNKVGTRPGSDKQLAAFNTSFHIDRSDFGVGLYAPMVSDRIDIRATTEAIAVEAPDAAADAAAEGTAGQAKGSDQVD